jgi:hypothetical protein
VSRLVAMKMNRPDTAPPLATAQPDLLGVYCGTLVQARIEHASRQMVHRHRRPFAGERPFSDFVGLHPCLTVRRDFAVVLLI